MNFIRNDLLNYFKATTKEKAKLEVNINSIGKYMLKKCLYSISL